MRDRLVIPAISPVPVLRQGASVAPVMSTVHNHQANGDVGLGHEQGRGHRPRLVALLVANG